MTTQQISGITPPLERDKPGTRYLRDVRVELIITETVTQPTETNSGELRQYLLSKFPEDTDTTTRVTYERESRTTYKDLHIQFDVPSNADNKEDAVSVSIYNVSRQKALRFFPTSERRIIMRVWAGYNNNPNIIFTGNVTKTSIAVERPNSVLQLQASQLDVLRTTPYAISYLPVPSRQRNILVRNIIEYANESHRIGLEMHTSVELRIQGSTTNPDDRSVIGFVHEGTCADALTRLLDPIGMNWFVHNGVFNVISKRNFDRFDTDPIIISERSGMIDTPKITEDGLDVQMLLTPTFIPGQNVVVHSRILSDIVPENKPFRIAKVSHRGNNWTGNMVTELSLQDFDKIGNTTDLATALPTDITSPAVILSEEL